MLKSRNALYISKYKGLSVNICKALNSRDVFLLRELEIHTNIHYN